MSSIVKRLFPLRQGPWETPDPFLFCVHHDDQYPAGGKNLGPPPETLQGRNIGSDFSGKGGWSMYHGEDGVPGFPAHPHRGFETVSVVRHGHIDHSDSMGASGRFGGGDTQWMTAGKGIVHCEMFPLLHDDKPNRLELFQIWLNLPKVSKFVESHFKMLWDHTIPKRDFKDANGKNTKVAFVAGACADAVPNPPPPDSWAARPESDVAIWTIAQDAGAKWTVPAAKAGSNRTVYFYLGSSATIGGKKIATHNGVEVQADAECDLVNDSDGPVEYLILQGRPIGEPVVQHGPFVMNTREEIQQTFVDYQRTRFGGWKWPNQGPLHGDKSVKRFAKYADGKEERPEV